MDLFTCHALVCGTYTAVFAGFFFNDLVWMAHVTCNAWSTEETHELWPWALVGYAFTAFTFSAAQITRFLTFDLP